LRLFDFRNSLQEHQAKFIAIDGEKMSTPNQRKIRNFILQPLVQFRYVMILGVWGVLGLSYIQGILLHSIGQVALQCSDQLNLPGLDIENAISSTWLVFGVSVLLNCVCAVGIGVYISYRFLAPSMGIRNFIKDLKDGNYERRKNLRKDDELGDVMNELNELAAVLEKKHGPSAG
jgi:hypothetical protein